MQSVKVTGASDCKPASLDMAAAIARNIGELPQKILFKERLFREISKYEDNKA